jgi:hypothetical protein
MSHPKTIIFKNFLTNWVTISFSSKAPGYLPRRRQSTAASVSRRDAVHSTASPLDRSRWDPQAAPYRCNTWSTPDASKCWALLATRTHRYRHSTVPPRTATHSRPVMLLSTLQKKGNKDPWKATGFHEEPTFRASLKQAWGQRWNIFGGPTYTLSWTDNAVIQCMG